MATTNDIIRTATLSDDGMYRYALSRTWCRTGPRALFIMLNPSTADGLRDDPTIRKCIGFASRLGMSGIDVVNLYALRSTDPSALRMHANDEWRAIGPDNDNHILMQIIGCHTTGGTVICAWGKSVPYGSDRPQRIQSLLRGEHVTPYALRLCADGTPSHPLMLPYSCKPTLLTSWGANGGHTWW